MFTAQPLLAKLERSLALTEAERHAISTVPVQQVDVPADHDIVHEGDQPRRCFLIVEGVTCVWQMVEGGRWQIDAFHIPGDMPDLHGLHLDVMDCDMWAVTSCRLGFFEHAALQRLCAEQPRIAAALWRLTVVDAAIYRQWVTNLGQRPATNRLAHLFCEMILRMDAVGRAEHLRCALPITQADLSDASGLSAVHINRTLQELREMGLITFGKGTLTIHNWDTLPSLVSSGQITCICGSRWCPARSHRERSALPTRHPRGVPS